jgi:type III restriction enzyme
MPDQFFDRPILNSPYEYPSRHWELDNNGQPTQQILDKRRGADFITPIPKVKTRGGGRKQESLDLSVFSAGDESYDHTAIINGVRQEVDKWRQLPEAQWRVTPETARLLKHWRHHKFASLRPFFCQIEAAETIIWLTEVAPTSGAAGKRFLEHMDAASESANPGLSRLALKLATGAGKTTVMAMVIAWMTINAVRHPQSKRFTRGFLIVAPGITIRDRLRVLMPNDPESYFESRELVPQDMLQDLNKAKIVITNYHAFKLRERLDISKGGRSLLQGHGEPIQTLESEGQMLQRVMPELLGLKQVLVINDEAHHCYRHKPRAAEDEELKGDERKEAEENNKAAQLWISGIEALSRKIEVSRVVDLSATPFFLSGSGYAEGTLFPWTMSDFSLMDAIECGIVKLPRVPVSDNISDDEMPMFRVLWQHIGKRMPKKGRGAGAVANPLDLPVELQTAMEALYGHYEKTSEVWADSEIGVPPCFIFVCNNTASSKLIYDFVSGFTRTNKDDDEEHIPGRFDLFRNHDQHGNPLHRPKTLLIDSAQLESGDSLDKNFLNAAKGEIDQFRKDRIERMGNIEAASKISDQDLLREVMNTVGKPGKLGESVRCVVSVSMLTEGWDANTVTHVLGVRAFGTQLLCEQVVGRALRRQSYELNEENKFDVEYADVLGIPFDFTAKPTVVTPKPPPITVHVQAVSPERDHLEIKFPNVAGYRVELPAERLEASFTAESTYVLSPEEVGPTLAKTQGIIGESADLTIEHLDRVRTSTIIMHLTKHLVMTKWQDDDGDPKLHLYGQLKRIARKWLNECLVCKGNTYPGLLLYHELAEIACERITASITQSLVGERPVVAVIDPYNPIGSTKHVNFNTSKTLRWETSAQHCHVNWAVLDSTWEGEFCRIVEEHPKVVAYVKNHSMGFEVPYQHGGIQHRYIPDFIVLVADGRGEDDLLQLIVEIKGYRNEQAKTKRLTMDTYWVPGVNNGKRFGRWAFAEFTDIFSMPMDLEDEIRKHEMATALASDFDKLITGTIKVAKDGA